MGSHGCEVWRRCPHSHTHHQIQDFSSTPLHHFPHCPLHHHHHHHHHRHHFPVHHHHRHCPHCPLHNHHFHGNFQSLPSFTPLLQNPHLFAPLPLETHPISGAVDYNEANTYDSSQISQALEHIELNDEEEDDDPVFVLSDEWREFFAKSEARRQLEKKQRKKGKK